jgi:hypothetical protein
MFPKHVYMDGATDGATGGAAGGSGAGEGGAPNGAAGGGAGPVGGTPGVGDAGAGAAAPWYGANVDAEIQAYVATKGWADPVAAINSYRNAEKMIGRDPNTLVTIPRPDDTAGQRALYAKLGMPESADKYDFKAPEGVQLDEGRMGWAKQAAHQLGLSQKQFEGLVAADLKANQDMQAAQAKEYEAYVATDRAALQKEWGVGFDKKMQQGKAAAAGLGINGEVIDAIEAALGFSGTMKLFASLGEKMGEDGFVTPEARAAGFNAILTPAEAKVQWEQKLLDPNFKAALFDRTHPGHNAAKADQTRMFKLMNPEE